MPPPEESESDQCTTRGSLPSPPGCTTKSLHSPLWGILGLGSHFAHKTNNLEFIFPFKHSIFWALPENVWKDVLEELSILFWNLKPDYKMSVFKSALRFLSNSNLGWYSESREDLKTSGYAPQSCPTGLSLHGPRPPCLLTAGCHSLSCPGWSPSTQPTLPESEGGHPHPWETVLHQGI